MSEVAKRPPSRGTMGRRSGGITGRAVRIIHSGLLPLARKDSTTSSRLTARVRFWLSVSRIWPARAWSILAISALSCSLRASRSISRRSSRTASAPILATKEPRPQRLSTSWKRASSISSRRLRPVAGPFASSVLPGSRTIKLTKYRTFSSTRGLMSSRMPMRLGMPLKYQMWLTGVARSMWPMRSRRTFALVTCTPHLSQTTSRLRYLMRLYLPQAHSQSFVGPKMRSQYRPSRSGRRVR